MDNEPLHIKTLIYVKMTQPRKPIPIVCEPKPKPKSSINDFHQLGLLLNPIMVRWGFYYDHDDDNDNDCLTFDCMCEVAESETQESSAVCKTNMNLSHKYWQSIYTKKYNKQSNNLK